MREIKFRAWIPKHHNPDYQEWLKTAKMNRQLGLLKQFEQETGKNYNDGFVPAMQYGVPVSSAGKLMELEGGWDYQSDNDTAILMQYTGLKDKNGKEIYEGDVVTVKGKSYGGIFTSKVIFHYGMFSLSFGGKAEGMLLGGNGYEPRKVEIIGNIYENLELLK